MKTPLDAEKQAFRIAAKKVRIEANKQTPNAGNIIAEKIIRLSDIPAKSIISGFWPLADEIDTRPLLEALHKAGHKVLLPVMQGANQPLVFACWAPGDKLVTGNFKTQEPAPEKIKMVPQIMICPLLAFDRQGFRMGYGGGFYDRSIAQIQSNQPLTTIGIAFAAQEVESVITGPYDQPLDKIITEKEVIDIS